MLKVIEIINYVLKIYSLNRIFIYNIYRYTYNEN